MAIVGNSITSHPIEDRTEMYPQYQLLVTSLHKGAYSIIHSSACTSCYFLSSLPLLVSSVATVHRSLGIHKLRSSKLGLPYFRSTFIPSNTFPVIYCARLSVYRKFSLVMHVRLKSALAIGDTQTRPDHTRLAKHQYYYYYYILNIIHCQYFIQIAYLFCPDRLIFGLNIAASPTDPHSSHVLLNHSTSAPYLSLTCFNPILDCRIFNSAGYNLPL